MIINNTKTWFSSAKVIILVSIMVSLSYFLGIIWYIGCSYLQSEPDDIGSEEESIILNGSFIRDFRLDESIRTALTSVFYFAFSTLSTLSNNDFHPRSTNERLMCIGLLLIGVNWAAYLMNSLIQIFLE